MIDYPMPPKAHHFTIKTNKHSFDCLGSIVKVTPAPQPELSYGELVFTEQDATNIEELIRTMAHNNKFQLLFKQGHLKTLGSQINHVHPLKFLATIFKNPELKPLMKDIREDYFKWSELVKGIAPGLTREGIKGKLDLYLNDFSNEIGYSAESIDPYFQSGEWENFIIFLIES